MARRPRASAQPARTQVAFLLTQLGTVAAEQFGTRVAELSLTRPQSGLLRLIARTPGRSQREVAAALGAPPSRLVALVDDLEDRGLLERRRSADDRRAHQLYLTSAGEQMMARLGRVAAQHEADVTAVLDDAERGQLNELLGRLAEAHGLTPGVHPGYRRLGPDDS